MASNVQASLSGKVAIVTGASRGIGIAIALELANRGAKVALTYTSPSSQKAVEETVYKINALEMALQQSHVKQIFKT
ncbi:Short-chain dehydrogenase/reductase SDR [Neofusicoccum parvum]|uniref:Short-chain dehydrogenase/reductase SDR n=1 Tax=Neofusicoccum parvum TaxID=310453 RepID=A0ACB5SAU9_9PEZI|nr:Short-chain dehydrogenase/reductase SDR [Neofusicoccum parvum]